jgi:heavy metal sensor kinase
LRTRSIGVRLSLWYAVILGIALVSFGAVVWWAVQHSLNHAIDDTLRDRVEGIRQFIEAHSSSLSLEEMQMEFREHSVLGPGGDLFQVLDKDGSWLYRSDPLYDEHVPVYRVSDLGSNRRFEALVIQGAPLRFLSQSIEVAGHTYSVQVAAPLHEVQEGLRDLVWILLATTPLVLAVATMGGYWMSRRALAPVDAITLEAKAIGADNLSRRLAVPNTGDELQRLSETLNEMIGRLDEAFQRITRFTADASHELRTPLALMRTTAELALRGDQPQQEYRESLGQILAELERTSHLVENLLLIARVDSSGAQLQLSGIDLTQTLREACLQAAPLFQAKHIQFDSQIPQHPIAVKGDAQALRRLFLILIDNAVKYTPSGGSVNVSAGQTNDAAVVTVIDTGIGIPSADLPHIFERFYRVDKARSREQGGAGLGLSIARWIVETHGGQINIDSQLNTGTTVRVSLDKGSTRTGATTTSQA